MPRDPVTGRFVKAEEEGMGTEREWTPPAWVFGAAAVLIVLFIAVAALLLGEK